MKYKCNICEWIYDDEQEDVKFSDLPESYKCPMCGADKEMFSKIDEY